MIDLNEADPILRVLEEPPLSQSNQMKNELEETLVAAIKDEQKSAALTQFMKTKNQKTDQTPHYHILFWTLFKQKFKLAQELIVKYGADCRVLNSNGASMLHILFAHFNHDPANAKQLALLLLDDYGLDPNLKDGDGKTPLHVAIGK
jgi:uncharacterized membrane protein YgaE (UPF0421/DUF939 family)